MLTKEQIEEFRQIWKEEFGEEISYEYADERGEQLLELVRLVYGGKMKRNKELKSTSSSINTSRNYMELTEKIQKAIDLASKLHLGQMRKSDKDLPYISHLFSVAWILSNYTDDQDIIVAGLLHDVLEDVKGYCYSDMERDFGTRVAKIVKGVSEDKDPNDEGRKKMPWGECKQKYIAGLETDSRESLLVCAADKIHNLQTMIRHYQERKEDLWTSFSAPKDKQLWFYEEVFKALKSRLDGNIMEIYEKKLEKFRQVVEAPTISN